MPAAWPSCILRKTWRQNARSKVRPTTAKPPSQITRKPPTVAIVDDDPAVCGSLKFSLELEGYAVRTYADAAEFLHAGDFASCDCFVIDQRMPGMTGMELIANLRDRKVQTPAILLISHPNAAVSARATKAGVAVVEKPLLGNMLVDRIREVCQKAD